MEVSQPPGPPASPARFDAPPTGRPKTFHCPACGGSITLKAVGVTINAVCSYCSSIIDVANENYRLILKANVLTRKTLLEIGRKGMLSGKTWEVVGYMEKTTASGNYCWDEYLLYNPYYGFRFLVQAYAHWSLFKVIRQDVLGAGGAAHGLFQGRNYTLFFRGVTVVSYVKGEFYWRVTKGERTACSDYISPPFMLSVEINRSEINVAQGEYLTASAVAKAFQITSRMPRPTGIAANQPPPYFGRYGKLWLTAGASLAMALCIQWITLATADTEDVSYTQVSIGPDQRGQTLSSEPFTLPKSGNLVIKSSSPVENNWVELDLSLVNEDTNDEYSIQHAIEYYYGYDEGVTWSEGKESAETSISRVPGGHYRLLIDVDAGAFDKNRPVNLRIRIKRDVPAWSSVWLAALLLLFYPVFATVRRLRFDGRRWAESDITPIGRDDSTCQSYSPPTV